MAKDSTKAANQDGTFYRCRVPVTVTFAGKERNVNLGKGALIRPEQYEELVAAEAVNPSWFDKRTGRELEAEKAAAEQAAADRKARAKQVADAKAAAKTSTAKTPARAETSEEKEG